MELATAKIRRRPGCGCAERSATSGRFPCEPRKTEEQIMADEREGAQQPEQDVASKDRIQTGGREANAAQPLNAAEDHGGAERYPSVDQTDAVSGEGRSFDPSADAPTPRQGAGDTSPAATTEARLGPAGDPVEGKR
jgi:hypothetical protein